MATLHTGIHSFIHSFTQAGWQGRTHEPQRGKFTAISKQEESENERVKDYCQNREAVAIANLKAKYAE